MRYDHKPTKADVCTARSLNYPPIGDQLDVIFKMAAALQAQGIFLPQEVHDWIEKCKSVKSRFPI